MASCRGETRVPGDMVTFMERNNYGSNQDMANHLRAFLDDKYDDKYWAVVVCAGKNYRASDYFLVGRGKKDAFAMSYTVNRTYTISQSAIDGINSLPQNDYDLNSGFNSVMNRVGWESIRLVTFGGNCDEGVDRNPSIQRTHSRQNTYCKRGFKVCRLLSRQLHVFASLRIFASFKYFSSPIVYSTLFFRYLK